MLTHHQWGPLALRAYNNTDNNSTSISKSQIISFAYNIHYVEWILLKFCIEHDSHTAVLCAKFQKDSFTATEAMNKHDFARFPFKTDLCWYLCILLVPQAGSCICPALKDSMQQISLSQSGGLSIAHSVPQQRPDPGSPLIATFQCWEMQ